MPGGIPPRLAAAARALAASLGIDCEVEDITPRLQGAGCYRPRTKRSAARFRNTAPAGSKLVLPWCLTVEFNVTRLVALDPDGNTTNVRPEPAPTCSWWPPPTPSSASAN
jgi:hypothetical protein